MVENCDAEFLKFDLEYQQVYSCLFLQLSSLSLFPFFLEIFCNPFCSCRLSFFRQRQLKQQPQTSQQHIVYLQPCLMISRHEAYIIKWVLKSCKKKNFLIPSCTIFSLLLLAMVFKSLAKKPARRPPANTKKPTPQNVEQSIKCQIQNIMHTQQFCVAGLIMQ